ncbi:hypothetical protein [Coraliomargarita parva]|uniref:hypothetical protein n=1 Tax=Coraliomargarita parva TaxID=3014050 RepID=UPI0022B45D4E|nr:hypothetical protein [Coraliomargarita parva]
MAARAKQVKRDKEPLHPPQSDQVDQVLRYLGWAYILLLVIEGALRKWLLPGLSDVLLLARDPVVLAAYGWCLIHKRLPFNGYVVAAALLTLLCALTATFWGHGDIRVTLFGIRTNFLHFPFAFIMGRVFFREDVIRIGRWWLWGSLAMTVIIVLQFYSPQSAWINRSVGGAEGGGFAGALGRYRPPGTFSFIIGTVQFYTLTTAFLIAGMTQHRRYSQLLVILSAGALLLAIPVSISRSLILSCAITIMTGLATAGMQKGAALRLFRILVFGVLGLLIVAQIPVFDEAREAFTARWESSTGKAKGGFKEAILGRVVEMLTGPFTETAELPIFGYGIGMGTQVGSQLMTGEEGFSLGESEWYRMIGEYGLALGFLFIVWRIALTFKLFTLGMTALRRGNGLGLIILSTAAFNIITGQLGQTTVNGFTVIGIGLTIAAMRIPKTPKKTTDEPSEA